MMDRMVDVMAVAPFVAVCCFCARFSFDEADASSGRPTRNKLRFYALVWRSRNYSLFAFDWPSIVVVSGFVLSMLHFGVSDRSSVVVKVCKLLFRFVFTSSLHAR